MRFPLSFIPREDGAIGLRDCEVLFPEAGLFLSVCPKKMLCMVVWVQGRVRLRMSRGAGDSDAFGDHCVVTAHLHGIKSHPQEFVVRHECTCRTPDRTKSALCQALDDLCIGGEREREEFLRALCHVRAVAVCHASAMSPFQPL